MWFGHQKWPKFESLTVSILTHIHQVFQFLSLFVAIVVSFQIISRSIQYFNHLLMIYSKCTHDTQQTIVVRKRRLQAYLFLYRFRCILPRHRDRHHCNRRFFYTLVLRSSLSFSSSPLSSSSSSLSPYPQTCRV